MRFVRSIVEIHREREREIIISLYSSNSFFLLFSFFYLFYTYTMHLFFYARRKKRDITTTNVAKHLCIRFIIKEKKMREKRESIGTV